MICIVNQKHPRATMVDMRHCMVCQRRAELREAQVTMDSYPRRVFLHCDRILCCHAVIQSLKECTGPAARPPAVPGTLAHLL